MNVNNDNLRDYVRVTCRLKRDHEHCLCIVFALDFAMLCIVPQQSTTKVVKQYRPYRRYSTTSAVSYKGDILSCGIHKENKISLYDPDSEDVWVETDIDVSGMARERYLFNI